MDQESIVKYITVIQTMAAVFYLMLKLNICINTFKFTVNRKIFVHPKDSYSLGYIFLYMYPGNRDFLYEGALATFDNGVKLIVMHRCIVSLDYGTSEGRINLIPIIWH